MSVATVALGICCAAVPGWRRYPRRCCAIGRCRHDPWIQGFKLPSAGFNSAQPSRVSSCGRCGAIGKGDGPFAGALLRKQSARVSPRQSGAGNKVGMTPKRRRPPVFCVLVHGKAPFVRVCLAINELSAAVASTARGVSKARCRCKLKRSLTGIRPRSSSWSKAAIRSVSAGTPSTASAWRLNARSQCRHGWLRNPVASRRYPGAWIGPCESWP